ncbi:hypothetical protein CHS0354_029704 [Potamilus streckersoni]|uniref:Glycerate kinase n=1 Tax=Potamilus streckersoni TaxID=2493646 RepID=A0AAE0RTJ8_9BIVA|nr:hypothetical protein CHS0354_029704 [Potamilus streckersoni]
MQSQVLKCCPRYLYPSVRTGKLATLIYFPGSKHSLMASFHASRPQSPTRTMPQSHTEQHDMVRKDSLEIFRSALDAVSPGQMIQRVLRVINREDNKESAILKVEGREYQLHKNVYVVGFGKAVSGMARAVEDCLKNHIIQGVISIPKGSREQLLAAGKGDLCLAADSKIKVYEGAQNNLPDEDAHKAALAIQNLATAADKGGGSALCPFPCPPITLMEEQELTKLMSRSGATINELNLIRRNIEVLKGGGLGQIARPAQVISLILSDVIGDKLDIIGSGPTVPKLSSPRQCLDLINRFGLVDKVATSILSVLETKALDKKRDEEAVPYSFHLSNVTKLWNHIQNVIIGSNAIAASAAVHTAEKLGYKSLVLMTDLEGEAQVRGVMFARLAKYTALCFSYMPPNKGSGLLRELEIQLIQDGISKENLIKVHAEATKAYNSGEGVCIICGGETTVTVKGNGRGGRNQEIVLACALEMKNIFSEPSLEKYHVQFLSCGTDGQDGPTDAAGAITDKHLAAKASENNIDLKKYLEDNDSYSALKKIDGGQYLIQTGLTGTNVMDIQVLIVKLM